MSPWGRTELLDIPSSFSHRAYNSACLFLQIVDMLNEVKFGEYLETGKQVTEINLGDFIKLYINHRPACGLLVKEIEAAFQVLGYENEEEETSMNRNDLLLLLQQKGGRGAPREGSDRGGGSGVTKPVSNFSSSSSVQGSISQKRSWQSASPRCWA